MGRKTILLIVAALIAALGSSMVFLYVRGADNRAQEEQAPVQVLKAVSVINPGETLQEAQSAGKLDVGPVPRSQVLSGAVNSISGINDQVALTAIYPNEQIITSKFGASGTQDVLTMPEGNIAMSVNLSDTGRVAGFVTPGAEVAIFFSGAPDEQDGDTTRVLLPRVPVIAVGATTVVATTTTTEEGAQTTEELPKTLFTLAVDQGQAEKLMYAVGHGELTFALLNDKSKIKPSPGVTAGNLFG